MRIRATFIIDIDPAEWEFEYGRCSDASGRYKIADVRKDILSSVLTSVRGAVEIGDEGAEVVLAE
jgi:hypothetical protein